MTATPKLLIAAVAALALTAAALATEAAARGQHGGGHGAAIVAAKPAIIWPASRAPATITAITCICSTTANSGPS